MHNIPGDTLNTWGPYSAADGDSQNRPYLAAWAPMPDSPVASIVDRYTEWYRQRSRDTDNARAGGSQSLPSNADTDDDDDDRTPSPVEWSDDDDEESFSGEYLFAHSVMLSTTYVCK